MYWSPCKITRALELHDHSDRERESVRRQQNSHVRVSMATLVEFHTTILGQEIKSEAPVSPLLCSFMQNEQRWYFMLKRTTWAGGVAQVV